MDFDKPKVYGDTSITDGLVDSVSGGSIVNSVNSETAHSATAISNRIVFAWNLA